MRISNIKAAHGAWLAFAGILVVCLSLAGCSLRSIIPEQQGTTAGQGETSVTSASSASSAAEAQKPEAASPAGQQQNGQLGMIFEVNNIGWQKVMNIPAKRGMTVVLVVPNQPGAKAGVVEGDVVTKMNGVDVFNANVANREIRKLKVGDKVSLDLERKAGPAKVDLTVEPMQKLDLAAMLNDMLKKDPNNAKTYFLRAAYTASDAKAAITDYNKAIELKPDFVSAYVQRGTLLQSVDQDRAMKDFDKAISLDPSYQPAYVNRSVLLASQKSYDKALQDDKKAVELDPTDPAAYTNLGIGYINQGDRAQAMAAEDKALQLDPLFGPALLYRGLMYRDASKADLENAARLVKDERLRATAEAALKKVS